MYNTIKIFKRVIFTIHVFRGRQANGNRIVKTLRNTQIFSKISCLVFTNGQTLVIIFKCMERKSNDISDEALKGRYLHA